jgi:prepilin-type N-terminal cleavage/methylation domain-containing protein
MSKQHPDGVTAFELMVAMAIVAILLSTGVPAVKNYVWNLRLRTAMDTLQTDLNLARAHAISHNTAMAPASPSGGTVGSFSPTSTVTGNGKAERPWSNMRAGSNFSRSAARVRAITCVSIPTGVPRAAMSVSFSAINAARAMAAKSWCRIVAESVPKLVASRPAQFVLDSPGQSTENTAPQIFPGSSVG